MILNVDQNCAAFKSEIPFSNNFPELANKTVSAKNNKHTAKNEQILREYLTAKLPHFCRKRKQFPSLLLLYEV